MKNHVERWAIVCFLAAALPTCAKPPAPTPEEGGAPEAALAVAKPFRRGVGAPIAGDDARRWVGAYQARFPAEVRSHFYGRDALEALLRRPGAEGVSIQRALDDEGRPVLVLVPLDGEGRRLPDDASTAAMVNSATGFFVVDNGVTCPPICGTEDTAGSPFQRDVGEAIPGSTALRWVRAYTTRHPGEVRSHFYGRDVLEALLARPGGEGVSIQRALDDEGRSILVLVPLDERGRPLPGDGARGDEGEGDFFAVDNGLQCPPTCSTEEVGARAPAQ
jgi:hypothetical protein